MEKLIKDIIGLTKSESKKLVEDSGYVYRVVREDGINHMVTADFRTDRINVVLTTVVVDAYIG